MRVDSVSDQPRRTPSCCHGGAGGGFRGHGVTRDGFQGFLPGDREGIDVAAAMAAAVLRRFGLQDHSLRQW